MALRPLHFCEVLEEEHSALYGHEDWRVLQSDIHSLSNILGSCREMFGDAPFVPVDVETGIEDQKKRLAAILTEQFIDTSTLLIDDERLQDRLPTIAASLILNRPEPYQRDRIRQRNRETLDAWLGGSLTNERRTWLFEARQIRDARAFAARWRGVFDQAAVWAQEHAGLDPADRIDDIVVDLNHLVTGPVLSSVLTREMLEEYLSEDTLTLLDSDGTVDGEDLEHLNRRILDDVFSECVQSAPEARLAKQIEIIHANGQTSALCLSGGGIRSATFGLGILQGLARRNLLDKFDYISTVSGGGYIGGWLSSWSRRHPNGMRGVSGALASAPRDKLSPDPPPVSHLREFSNYLTPRVGALTGDTLTVVAIYIRNLLLNWFVLLPLLIAALLLPRLVFAIDFSAISADVARTAQALAAVVPSRAGLRQIGALLSETSTNLQASLKQLSLGTGARSWYWTGIVFLALSFGYFGMTRPARDKYHGPQRHYLSYGGVVPLVLASLAFTAAWARHAGSHGAGTPWRELVLIATIPLLSAFAYGLRFIFTSATRKRATIFAQLRGLLDPRLRFGGELSALAIAAAITVALLAIIVTYIFPAPSQAIRYETFPSPIMAFAEKLPVAGLYVVFAVPLVLGVFFICGAIFVGLASRVNQDYDREWWARCSGLTFSAIVGWVLLTATVVFGPVLIHLAPTIAASLGGAAGIASYVLSRYRAEAEKTKSGSSSALGTALSWVTPVFVVVLLAFIALGTSIFFAPRPEVTDAAAELLENVTWQSRQTHAAAPAPAGVGEQFASEAVKLQARPGVPMFDKGGAVQVTTSTSPRPLLSADRLAAWNHLRCLQATSVSRVALLIIALLTVTAFASRFVNANKFSMHSMYRNRLIRAYLGASRLHRDPNPVTGFDPQDDLPMHFLRPEFLWVASFRNIEDFSRELDDVGDSTFKARLRDAAYRVRSRKDLQSENHQEDFAIEMAQVINCVMESVDLSAEPVPPVMRAAELAEAWRVQFAEDVKWLWGNLRHLRWTPRARPVPTTWSLSRQYAEERASVFVRGLFDGIPWLRHVVGSRLFAMMQLPPPQPRPSFAMLRKNREKLDEEFATSVYPYDQPIVKTTDVRDVEALCRIVRKPKEAPANGEERTFGENLYVALGDGAAILPRLTHANPHLREDLHAFARALNRVIEKFDLELELASGFEPVSTYPPSSKLFRKNRYILDRNLAGALHPLRSPRPMHVVNMALNLVRGQNLAWQERKAESFTTSPMHTGSFMLGYRDSSRYGDPSGITLGTAVAISGAAVSPNRGQKTSTALAFLMTLFNVRLGWWLGNPGVQGQRTWTAEGPQPSTQPLIAEASGDTNDRFPYVYLSDGGHFENLGLYEMVLRRRHFIVISDATCDRNYAFDDLGNAIRKIRTDLGIPIDIDKMYIYPKGSDKLGKYCATGKIRYSYVDMNGKDGMLLYIKPGVYPNVPTDIYNYAKISDDFPHETTVDQWFSESQFESYRMLGSHIVDQICYGDGPADPDDDAALIQAQNWCAKSMEEFFERATDYLKIKQTIPPPTRMDDAVSLLTGKFLELFDETPVVPRQQA